MSIKKIIVNGEPCWSYDVMVNGHRLRKASKKMEPYFCNKKEGGIAPPKGKDQTMNLAISNFCIYPLRHTMPAYRQRGFLSIREASSSEAFEATGPSASESCQFAFEGQLLER